MKTKLAVAMALVVAGIGAGLGPAPFAAAQSSNCPVLEDFTIPDSKPSGVRTLQAGESEIGLEDVSASGGAETLNVEFVDAGANGELVWTVYHLDSNDDCVKYDPTNCDRTMATNDEGETFTCTLDPPNSGSKDYWVHYEENSSQNSIDYRTWV